jgi:hypothetical protein
VVTAVLAALGKRQKLDIIATTKAAEVGEILDRSVDLEI